MRYAAKYDFPSKLITHGIIIVTLLLLAAALNSFPEKPSITLGPAIMVITIFITWGYCPMHYAIKEDTIIIKRPFKTLQLSLKDVHNISLIRYSDLGGNIRLFGSGGLFGYNGIFVSNTIGRYHMWCTNKETLVLIEYKDKKILISPSENHAFLNDATEHMDHWNGDRH
jgi:hypothetical protein